MLNAFNQGTRGVSGAFDSLGAAAGKSPDLSGVAKAFPWVIEGDPTAAGSSKLRNPNAGAPKLATARANPDNETSASIAAEFRIDGKLIEFSWNWSNSIS